eukprot:g13159.t1
MKRSAKRSIYIQVMLFSMNSIYTLFKDRKQELMIFATGNIYRETGTASKNVQDKEYSMEVKSEEKILSKKVELQVVRNEKKETSRSPAEVELQELKTRDRKASRNSWVDIYNETTALRKHRMLLGQKVELDEWLEWRIKWGQRGAGVFGLFSSICYLAKQNIVAYVLGALFFIFIGIMYYKNVSIVIVKRLLGEPNVVIIIVLSLCVAAIDIARPNNAFSPPNGGLYVLEVCAFVFLDALKVKSRMFVIIAGIIFVSLNINEIYNRTFKDTDQGVILFNYTIHGNKYTFMKRSAKRSIFIQIMLFSMAGIYTLFKDRKQELMIFATGNIYRETGTASKEVEDKQYSMKLKSEKSVSV